MNNIDKTYLELCQDILNNGTKKKTRTGTDSISVFGRQIRHKMSDGFPLLTTKKMYWKGIVAELLWFLKGQTNIKYLLENDCHIWDGDAYKNYLHKVIRDKDIVRYLKSYSTDSNGVPTIEPYSKNEFIDRIKNDESFAAEYGNLGPIYGKQWRRVMVPYNMMVIDQISNLINELKTNPDSRRLMVNAWNVSELDSMVLPPCHYGFQCYVREGKYLSLMWNQRSVDVPLGLPFNIASYGLLLHILAKITNKIPDELIGNLGDCHIYENQIEGIKEQINKEPYELSSLRINTEFWPTETGEAGVGNLIDNVDWLIRGMEIDDFQIENYQSHPSIKIPLSN